MDMRVQALRYDAARGAFEGRVDVERDGRTFRYPVRLEAPESAARDWIEASLVRQALRMSDTPQRQPEPGLVVRLSDALARIAHPFRARSTIPVRTDVTRFPQARLH
jgi:hypothetical protein